MSKFRAKDLEVLEALRFVPDGRRGRRDPHTAGLPEVSAFAGINNEALVRDIQPGEWILRSSLSCWTLTHDEFCEKYVEVGVDETEPPVLVRNALMADLAQAAEDAFLDHPDFARWWAESSRQDRQRTRARLREALAETST